MSSHTRKIVLDDTSAAQELIAVLLSGQRKGTVFKVADLRREFGGINAAMMDRAIRMANTILRQLMNLEVVELSKCVMIRNVHGAAPMLPFFSANAISNSTKKRRHSQGQQRQGDDGDATDEEHDDQEMDFDDGDAADGGDVKPNARELAERRAEFNEHKELSIRGLSRLTLSPHDEAVNAFTTIALTVILMSKMPAPGSTIDAMPEEAFWICMSQFGFNQESVGGELGEVRKLVAPSHSARLVKTGWLAYKNVAKKDAKEDIYYAWGNRARASVDPLHLVAWYVSIIDESPRDWKDYLISAGRMSRLGVQFNDF